MNAQPKGLWEQLVNEPRRFLLWLAGLSLAMLGLLLGAEAMLHHTPPLSLGFRSVFAFLLLASVTGFLFGFFGFFLALIPPLTPLFRWLVRRSVFLAACLITLVALFYALENWRGKLAWEGFKREAAAMREPVELHDIIPPQPSDYQNAAAAPLFKPLRNEFDPEWQRLHTGPNGLTNTADHLKLKFRRDNQDDPTEATADWKTGRRANLRAWQDYYRNPPSPQTQAEAAQRNQAERYGLPASVSNASGSITNRVLNEFPTSPHPQSPAMDVLLALSPGDATVEELRAACARPQAQFPLHFEDGFNMLLPHLARMKNLSQFLALRITAELEASQTEKAAADQLLGFRVVNLIRSEPLLISQLVRIAQIQISLNPLWEGLADHRWSAAQLTEFEQALGQYDFLADYQHGMRGERVCCTWTIDYLRRDRLMQVLDLGQGADRGFLEETLGSALFQLIPRGWFDQNKASIGRMHLELILPAVDVQGHQVQPVKVNRLASGIEQGLTQRTPYNYLGSLLLPPLTKASERAAEAQAAVDLARTACVLERHRLALGTYPERLDALTPRFTNQLPHDLITGRSLQYRRTNENSFIVYSVGWNEKDNDGNVARAKDKNHADWKEGDWVWQMPGK